MKKQKPKGGITTTSSSGFSAPEHPHKAKSNPPSSLRIPPLLLEGDDPPSPVAPLPDQKSASAPPAEKARPGIGSLPDSYGTGKLLLLARDPHSLYAHWDLTADQQSRYNSLSSDGHFVLRISSAAGTATEVHLRPEARSSFVDVAQAGATYTADLGYYQSGTWKTVATSLPAVTPSDSPSEDKSVRFAEVGSEGELGAIAQTVASGKPGGQEADFAAAQNIPPPRVEWLPALDKPVMKPDEVPSQIGMQLRASTRQSSALLSPAEWTPTQEQALAELLGPVRLPRTSSLELTEWVRREIQREIAAIQFAQPLSAPVSSWSAAEPPQVQGFWFNVNAELIIYGATEPTATVTLAGQPVELRPDGTFSCRFALPDGEYELELAARSARDEALHAKLKFRRRTEGPSAGKPAG